MSAEANIFPPSVPCVSTLFSSPDTKGAECTISPTLAWVALVIYQRQGLRTRGGCPCRATPRVWTRGATGAFEAPHSLSGSLRALNTCVSPDKGLLGRLCQGPGRVGQYEHAAQQRCVVSRRALRRRTTPPRTDRMRLLRTSAISPVYHLRRGNHRFWRSTRTIHLLHGEINVGEQLGGIGPGWLPHPAGRSGSGSMSDISPTSERNAGV